MALTNLHQRGLLGDETLQRFEAAEKELEAEIVDVVQEANTFRQGWGGLIFATATEMAQAERTREIVMDVGKVKAQEGELCHVHHSGLSELTCQTRDKSGGRNTSPRQNGLKSLLLPPLRQRRSEPSSPLLHRAPGLLPPPVGPRLVVLRPARQPV